MELREKEVGSREPEREEAWILCENTGPGSEEIP